MLGPALPHLGPVCLERSQQINRIQTTVQRALPGIDDRLSHLCGCSGRGVRLQLATGEQTLPALTKLSSAYARIHPRCYSQPLGRHGPTIIAPRSTFHRTSMNPGFIQARSRLTG